MTGKRFHFSLVMLFVDERCVVAKAVRPACLKQLGSVLNSGVKLFLSVKFLPSKATLFFFLSLFLVSRKSLAIFVHLAVAFLVLLIA